MSVKHYYGMCPRCGVKAKERKHPLCRDCRDTMIPEDIREWEDDEKEQQSGEADAA